MSNKLIVTNHGLVRACERLFCIKLEGKGDNGKVMGNLALAGRADEFLKNAVILSSTTLIKGTVYRAIIEGFDNYRAVIAVDEKDITKHKLLTIKEVK